jgi:transposase
MVYDPAHQSVLVRDFLAKNKLIILEHISCSPDMNPVVCYLFLQLKSALKSGRFCDVPDIIKYATKDLKRLS